MMRILFISFSLFNVLISLGQVDYNDLREPDLDAYVETMNLGEYTLHGDLFTGTAIKKSIWGITIYHFENGFKHGFETSYYKNKNQKEELDYSHGVLISHKKWSKKGTLQLEIIYKKKVIKSSKTYYANGNLKTEEYYRRKGLVAKKVNYDRSGIVESKGKVLIDPSGRIEKQDKTGKWKYFNNKGEFKKKEKWRNGELITKRKK